MDFDPADYDFDDRVFCTDCREWGWLDSGDVKVCPACEERFCVECMKQHNCVADAEME
jgi:hypothetical protein